jgi:uncharacterized membrane protein YbhN (UPF0104 family)
MRRRLKQWWPVLKTLFTLAILVAIGRQFYRDLQHPDLWRRPLDPGWLLIAGLVYLLGLGFSCLFWYRLLRTLGQQPDPLATVRSYYISHLGKYLPGRAWALLLRANLVRGPGVRPGVAGLTAFYEVVTTMATGALVALVLFVFVAPEIAGPFNWETYRRLFRLQASETEAPDRRVLLLFALTLFLPLVIIVLPPVFNRLARRVTRPFQREDSLPLPRVPLWSLPEGIAWTTVEWFLHAVSLWCVLHALLPRPLPWSLDLWVRLTAYLSAAYIAGFVIILVPSGLGIREFFLTLFLVPQLGPLLDEDTGQARALVVLTVLVLRLVWTSSELLLSGVLYCLPASLQPADTRVLVGPSSVHGPKS